MQTRSSEEWSAQGSVSQAASAPSVAMARRFSEATRILLAGRGVTDAEIALCECYEETSRLASRPRMSVEAEYRQRLRREGRRLLAEAKK